MNMTMEQFNELVWNFGANGIQNPELLSEEKWEVVAMAWADSDKKEEIEESDEVINSYYKEFVNA